MDVGVVETASGSAAGRKAMTADGQWSSLPRATVPRSSCEELRNPSFNLPSGYYLIKDTYYPKLLAVWCDMSLAVKDIQTRIGFVDVQRQPSGFYFCVFRQSTYSTVETIIPFSGGGYTARGLRV